MLEDRSPSVILSPRIRLLYNEIQKASHSALSVFWTEMEELGTPIIEAASEGDSFVTFVWRDDGTANHVAVVQDWGCDGIREHHMSRLPGSDVWYLTRRMRSDTRTTYQLSPSSSTNRIEPAPYRLDPLNQRVFMAYPSETGHDIQFSLLELPEAPALPWRQKPSVTAGSIQLHRPFADQRRLWCGYIWLLFLRKRRYLCWLFSMGEYTKIC